MIDANESKNTEDGDDAEFDYISHFKCLKIQSNPDGHPKCTPCGRHKRPSSSPFDATKESDSNLSFEYLQNRLVMLAVQTPCGNRCAHGNCLRKADKSPASLDFTNSVNLVLRCRNEMKDKSPQARYDHLMGIFKSSISNISRGISKDGLMLTSRVETDFKLAVDDSPFSRTISVCRIAFCRAYGVSHWYLDQMAQRFKRGEESGDRNFTDKAVGALSLDDAERIGKR